MNTFKCVPVLIDLVFYDLEYNFLKGVQIPSKVGVGSKLGSNTHVSPTETGFENYQKLPDFKP